MRIKTIMLCSFLFLAAGQQDVQAQGFLNKIKKVGKQIEKKVEKTLDVRPSRSKTSAIQSNKKTAIDRKVDAMVGAKNNRNAEDVAPDVRIPKDHTALLAPLGYDVAPEMGVKTFKPIQPPAKADAQVAWRDKMPDPATLTNASLVDMHNMLSTASDYADMSLSPAAHYANLVSDEILDRIESIEKMKEGMDEAMDDYDNPEAYNWTINLDHRTVVRAISSDAYKHMVRSSLEPLFTLKKMFDSYSDMTAYFDKHGGVKNAHKVAWTKWDPQPNKTQVSASTGERGTVVDGDAGSGKIDMGGVYYAVHVKERRAFVDRAEKVALSGKDVVIPDYVEYNGAKYPVTFIAASAFEGAKINSVKLPSTLKEIRLKAFWRTDIKELVIPASVKRIEGSAFSFCTNLTKVTFAGTSMELIEGCFAGCSKLQSVTFPASLAKDMTYDMFRDCKSLTRVVLPKNLRVIPEGTFAGCTNLKQLDIPATVTTIGGQAFTDCGITSLYMPNVTELKDGAFLDCNTLKTITIGKTLRDKLVSDNCWGYTTNFGENPYLKLVLKNGEVSLPSSVKVM